MNSEKHFYKRKKSILRLTFNPGLSLTGFWTTWPRTFVKTFCWPGIRFWTFFPKNLTHWHYFVYSRSAWCFTRTLHPDKTLYNTNLAKNCTTEKSVFVTWCVHKMLIFHSILHLHFFMVRWISVYYYFTFFSDKQTKIVHAHLLYKSDMAELTSYLKIGSLLLLIWEDKQDFIFDKIVLFLEVTNWFVDHCKHKIFLLKFRVSVLGFCGVSTRRYGKKATKPD